MNPNQGLTSWASPRYPKSNMATVPKSRIEHSGAEVRLHGRQDQVELDHLQRHGQGPVDVTVHNRGHVDGDPVLAHVEVVHTGDQGDKRSDVHGGLPVVADGEGLPHEEGGRGDHGHGHDPPC